MIQVDNYLRDTSVSATLDGLYVKVISFLRVYPYPQWQLGPHSHSDFELHFITAGRGQISMEGNEFTVRKGDFYITGPRITHWQITDPSDPMEEYCIECEMQDSVFSLELARLHSCAYRSDAVFEVLFKLADEACGRSPSRSLSLQSLILLLISKIYAVISQALPQKSPKQLKNPHYERIIGFIKANYTRELTLADTSNVLFICERQINRIMKKECGKSFHEYLMQLRLDKAIQLLGQGELSIEQVAQESGYSSKIYMYQAFSRNGLDTPASYKMDKTKN